MLLLQIETMKLLRQNITLIFIFISSIKSYGQIKIDNKLIFTSSDSNQRQIRNIGQTIESSNGVSFYTYISGQLIFSSTQISDSIVVDFVPDIILTTGTKLFIQCDSAIAKNVVIKIDNNPSYGLIRSDGDSLYSTDLNGGKVISIVFTDSTFQLINHHNSDCPNGFTSVNNSYCITTNEYSIPLTFWEASQYCTSLNSSLCTMGQWYYACQKSGLGLQNMTNNWEWINAGQNHTDAASQAGNGACTSQTSQSILSINMIRSVRCCYSK